MQLSFYGGQLRMLGAIRSHMQGHALPEYTAEYVADSNFFNVCLYSWRGKITVFRQIIIMRIAKSRNSQGTLTAHLHSCVFRKHRQSLSAASVYILSMYVSRGN